MSSPPCKMKKGGSTAGWCRHFLGPFLLILVIGICLKEVSSLANNNNNNKEGWNTRREWFQAQAAAAATTTAAGVVGSPAPQPALAAGEGVTTRSQQKKTPPYLMEEYYNPAATAPSAGRFYFPTLTPPFAGRATYRYDLGRNAWGFDQLLVFANVSATIRCNVVRLESTGGLWVHSPQWPTGEFCKLLDDLGSPVEHVVLPCNALEHTAPMAAFLKKYPKAKVWISPGQYGPFGSCGRSLREKVNMGYKVDGILGGDDPPPPWSNEFDIETLYVDLPQNAGPVSEVAFCHRPTKTLIATDAVIYIPDGNAPEIFKSYFDPALVDGDPAFWPKSVLQAVFLPLRTTATTGNAVAYPGYDAIKERLVRAPILRAFGDARAPKTAQRWIDNIVTGFDFDRIITSHFAAPIRAGPKDFASAYEYLLYGDNKNTKKDGDGNKLPPIVCQDWELLEGLNQVIAENNLGAPAIYDYKKGCL